MTNAVARLLITMYYFLYNSKIFVSSARDRVFIPFLSMVGTKYFECFLGYSVKRACPIPRNSTWFIRPFFLMRGWGLGTRLDVCNNVMLVVKEFNCPKNFVGISKCSCLTFNFLFLARVCVCMCVHVCRANGNGTASTAMTIPVFE